MAQKARTHGPGDLDFTDSNHGFTAQLSACTAMRLLQAVSCQADPGTARRGQHPGHSEQEHAPRSTTLELSLDRRTLEETYMKTFQSQPTPPGIPGQ